METVQQERDPIVPENGMSSEGVEAIDEENTVGVCEKMDPGEDTIIDEAGVRAFRSFRRRLEEPPLLDDSPEISSVFISSRDGDVQASSLPAIFDLWETDQDGDRIIETCIDIDAYELAMKTLRDDDAPRWRSYPKKFTVMFDDCGLVAFQTDEQAVVCAPVQWPWQHQAARPWGTRTPEGPTP